MHIIPDKDSTDRDKAAKPKSLIGIKILIAADLALGAYFGAMAIASYSSEFNSPPIISQLQLDQLIRAEAMRAGIADPSIVSGKFSEESGQSYAKKLAENKYELVLSAPDGHNLTTLKHELYHIADGHLDQTGIIGDSDILSGLAYMFWYEPQANIYELTGWKP
jgi:hypothetical protein